LKTFRFDSLSWEIFYRFDHFNEKKKEKKVQVYHIIQWKISEKIVQAAKNKAPT